MPLEMPDILNYLSATYMTGFWRQIQSLQLMQTIRLRWNEQIDVNSKDVPETAMSKEAQKLPVRRKSNLAACCNA